MMKQRLYLVVLDWHSKGRAFDNKVVPARSPNHASEIGEQMCRTLSVGKAIRPTVRTVTYYGDITSNIE